MKTEYIYIHNFNFYVILTVDLNSLRCFNDTLQAQMFINSF